MRILHTSDWHLGKSLYRVSMLPAQRDFINHLIETVQKEKVDVLIIAGDIYDVTMPSHEAVALLEAAFVELAKHCKIIVTNGNHDSAVRLGFGSPLFELAGLHLKTRIDDLTKPVVLEDEHGQIAFYGIPFLHPQVHQPLLAKGTPLEGEKTSHPNVMKLATDLIENHAKENGYDRTVVISHAWFAGGVGGDSEKPLSVGNLDNIPIDYVERFGYAALGHLHGPQDLRPNVRYCGSPYPYSFGEATRVRRSLLVDYTDQVTVTEIPVPQFKSLISLEGSLEDLLNNPDYELHADDYIRAVLTDDMPVADALARLRTRFAHVLTVEQPNLISALKVAHDITPGMSELEVFEKYMEYIRAKGPSEDEVELFKESLEYATLKAAELVEDVVIEDVEEEDGE